MHRETMKDIVASSLCGIFVFLGCMEIGVLSKGAIYFGIAATMFAITNAIFTTGGE